MQNIAFVTEELAELQSSGGIGTAFRENALMLAAHGHAVDIIYLPPRPTDPREFEIAAAVLLEHKIRLVEPDISVFFYGEPTYPKKSYGVFRYLLNGPRYDTLHFHDYKGLGFYSAIARRQRLAFGTTRIVVQMHGPTHWTDEMNGVLPHHPDMMMIKHLEKETLVLADELVCPSHYLADYWAEYDSRIPRDRITVIKNLCRLHGVQPRRREEQRGFDEIVFFGRHEPRKGLVAFCDALDILQEEIVRNRWRVTFLGPPGRIHGHPSYVYLARRSRRWRFPVNLLSGMKRNESVGYINESSALVVVPSYAENLPYTVYECAKLGVPLLLSKYGGGKEILSPDLHAQCLVEPTGIGIAEGVIAQSRVDALTTYLAESEASVVRSWLGFHSDEHKLAAPSTENTDSIGVTLGITHYERPGKLLDAVQSALMQTHPKTNIIVVDDGSQTDDAIATLEIVERILVPRGGRVIRQDNRYLGAARNTIIRASADEFVVFLDDDNIALPEMVERLLTAIVAMDVDAVAATSIFMEEDRRARALLLREKFETKVSYLPTAGPVSNAVFGNCFGDASGIYRRTSLEAIGGYSELRDVGFEDFELYLKLAQSGARLSVCPLPSYFYETGRPSMLSNTSTMANFNRINAAIDLGRSGDEFRAVIEYQLGSSAVANEQGRIRWEYESFDASGELARVLRSENWRSDLHVFASFADSIGARQFAEAIRRDAATIRAAAPEQVGAHHYVRMSRRQSAPNTGGDTLRMMRQCLLLGRRDQLVGLIVDEVRDGRCSQELAAVTTDLLAADRERSVPIELLNALVERQRLLGTESLSDYHLMMMTVAALDRTGESAVVRRALDELKERDEAEYLERYADLGKQREGNPEFGLLDHYMKHGRHEGRSGFGRMGTLLEMVRQTTGVSIALEEMGNLERLTWRKHVRVASQDGVPSTS